MSTAKHTIGPWDISEGSLSERPFAVGKLFYCVADVGNKYDAQLIAAAPDLLAACKAMVEAFTAGTAEQHTRRLAAITAITKAEGKA